jgi:8-oxo-dGTP pyrophosphatase MutT (NUDIX family)
MMKERACGIPSAVEPAPAASVIVVRSGVVPEVLLLKRPAKARFMPDAYVFPGGAVDAHDGSPEVLGLCAGISDAQASAALGVPASGLRFFVAAIRECHEECGLLFVRDGDRPAPSAAASAPTGRSSADLLQWCAATGRLLATDELVYFAHWITPPAMPRRFDTRFFLAHCPDGQSASLAGEEMADLVWLPPAEALTLHAAGRLELMAATRNLLSQIARFDTVEALLAFARGARTIETVLPEMPQRAPGKGG